MTGQFKQRLVGICVLLFLALILLPWLFGSNQPPVFEEKGKQPIDNLLAAEMPEIVKPASQTSQPVPDKLSNQVQSLTPSIIKEQESEELTPKAIDTHEQVSSSEENSKQSDPGTRIRTVDSDSLTKIQNSIVHTKPEKKLASSKEVKKVKAAISDIKLNKPSFTKIKLLPKSRTNSSASKLSEKNWIVQLGSFSDKENANKLIQQLKAKGYPAYSKISKNSEGSVITRVFVGPEALHQKAEDAVTRIENLFKVRGIIVKTSV